MDHQHAATAFTRLFDVLLQEDNPATILDSLAQIVGETLDVDRSLIYDVSFTRQEAVALTEWLNPSRPDVTATKATYPLALFPTAARLAYDTREPIESHDDHPHSIMIADGSAALLHGQMKIRSLLWVPFSFRHDGFYLLVFNHVVANHRWQASELEFLRAATRHVGMALLKIGLIHERALAEQRMYEGQKLESLGLLAGGVAHDFNNLMVGVLANAELLERRIGGDPRLRTLVQRIHHAGERAAGLATQLLAYAGKGHPGVAVVHLPAVVETTIKLVRSSIPPVEITTSVDDEVPPITCAIAQLEQVVMNLVVNAAEACPADRGTIAIRIYAVDLDATMTARYPIPVRPEPGRYVVFELSDNGPGIDATTLTRIFDPFFTTKPTGRGLGLSAVLGILNRHRGALRIESTIGVGTTFSIVWPASPGSLTAAPSPARFDPDGGKRLVLCIDDDAHVAEAVSALLADAEYTSMIAIGGAEGIARFREGASEVAAVILDLTMPVVSGRDVLREVRAIRPSVPVVLMSGFTEDTAIDELTDHRTRFIRKPFIGDALLEALRRVLDPDSPITRGS